MKGRLVSPREHKKRCRSDNFQPNSASHRKKGKNLVAKSAFLHIKPLGFPLISTATGSACEFIFLYSHKVYTVGRSRRLSDFVFDDRRVSQQHCQFYFDASSCKICLLDGAYFGECAEVRVSLNGVYVNGLRIGKGQVVELSAGDEISLVCGNEGLCSSRTRTGFLVERIGFVEEVIQRNATELRENELLLGSGVRPRLSSVIARASFLLSQCRRVLSNSDPISLIREIRMSLGETGATHALGEIENYKFSMRAENSFKLIGGGAIDGSFGELLTYRNELPVIKFTALGRNLQSKRIQTGQLSLAEECHGEAAEVFKKSADPKCFSLTDCNVEKDFSNNNLDITLDCMIKEKFSRCGKEDNNVVHLVDNCVEDHDVLALRKQSFPVENLDYHGEIVVVREKIYNANYSNVSDTENGTTHNKANALALDHIFQTHVSSSDEVMKDYGSGLCVPPLGQRFYLNRLQFMDRGSSDNGDVVSLPELFHPIESLVRVFIATFTLDVSWFLSYCNVPVHLPVTIACHNAERCWSSSPDSRTSVPFADFPNLLIVYPPFPETIAFGNVIKKRGIACHHPKLFVLQRYDNIRVVITSANLVPGQWNSVTNTVWWQDFPRAVTSDYLSLFPLSSNGTGEINQHSRTDFAAHLAGFIASLLADVPNQAHWILELAKYEFNGAVGHLVTSIPGIYASAVPYLYKSKHFLAASCCTQSSSGKLLGSILTYVVGISHFFRMSKDSNGVRLKKMASFLRNGHKNAYEMLEIVLKRNTSIPADKNAVNVLICNPQSFSEGDCIQLGFLPRDIAKWVAPLVDAGLFTFSAYICPKEALVTALEGCSNRVQLILYVVQGPRFSGILKLSDSEHISALGSLLASIQRSHGIWRLQEVLGDYKWPEHLETDFVFGSSSIGSVNAPFLAAFSAAAGKRSLQFSESEESDPDWGCWSASQELRNPSIKFLFPTIERVKKSSCGILASKHILCFSEKTWQKLKNIGMLCDAVPYSSDRVGYPMHVKVARRRFQAKSGSSSFGWVYCGSHNLSAAAWGRPISISIGKPGSRDSRTNSVLGSKLHICNYEIGIIFVVPPSGHASHGYTNLDDIVLPFVVPAPRYRPGDMPATRFAMREALAQLAEQDKYAEVETAEELMEDELPDEVLQSSGFFGEEKEDDKAYAEMLWGQS